ncbi:putative TOS1-like glycosyl hydrolase (DUF2401) [Phytophthora infestans]|uniref:glucan endo-1,3-beta-D-glucosidase n=1 Tax=Phytophthora infestans TaxID=4787 RepID=A0A8S9VFC7_PHYIN|nr:putative TOS1-like glycosyl hydrolase (DUF2401) [Phytophthora infestans]
MVRVFIALGGSLAMMAQMAVALATSVSFANNCNYDISLYDNKATETITMGSSTSRDLADGFSGMFRDGMNTEATLAQFAISGGKTWYSISTVPPGAGSCNSYTECAATSGKTGYNVVMSITPDIGSTTVNAECTPVTCDSADCEGAYLYPSDDTKLHNCPNNLAIKVTFCPNGSSTTSTVETKAPVITITPATTNAPVAAETPTITPTPAVTAESSSSASTASTDTSTPATLATPSGKGDFSSATIRSSFVYSGANAGSAAGTYGKVTEMTTCTTEDVSVSDPVGPLSEEVSMVFRGPMNIYNIAVFSGSPGSDWTKVSSYDASSGTQDNMVFMSNLNIDYTGAISSPQGYATADGKATARASTVFGGWLADATDTSVIGGGPCLSTGCEVNIMTETNCANQEGCIGYYDDMGFHGWDGGMKMFVTKVQMPASSTANLPAIWMLNAQVVRANQYGCNCRGWGAHGGCGELDISEVIETNTDKDKVSTHYYFYDGIVSPGGDNYASRPTDSAVTYVTILDNSGDGIVKIIEIGCDDFDFSVDSVSADTVSAWLSAPVKNLFN